MTEKERKEELQKCKDDIVYFMENYCTINGQPIVLSDYAKEFLQLNKENFTEEQTKAIIYGFCMTRYLSYPGLGIQNIEELLDKFPKKQHNLNFTWNLKKN